MIVKITKKKQLLSFMPVMISVNDSPYQMVKSDISLNCETDSKRAKFFVKLFGMKKQVEYNLDNFHPNRFELYFNLDIGKLSIIIVGFFLCIFEIFYVFFSNQSLGFTASMFFFLLVIIQSLFNSLHIGIKEDKERLN